MAIRAKSLSRDLPLRETGRTAPVRVSYNVVIVDESWSVPLELPPLVDDEVQLWRIAVTDVVAPDILRCLSPADQLDVARYRHAADRTRCATGRAALRLLLARHLAAAPSDIVVERTCRRCGGPHGKPRLSAGTPTFNVAGSGEIVMIALARQIVLGVDVEHATPSAVAAARDASNGPDDHDPLRLWCLKESALKAVGVGLAIAPSELELACDDRVWRVLAHPASDADLGAIRMREIEVAPAYRGALAYNATPRSVRGFSGTLASVLALTAV